MTRIRLPYVNVFRDRHGEQRYYFRRRGFKKTPLPSAPGSQEFMAAYQAALAGVETKQVGVALTKPGTVNAALVGYYTSRAFQEMAPGTKLQRRAILERFRNVNGDNRLHLLAQRDIVKMLGQLGPHARRNWLATLRGLLDFAKVEGFIRENPTAGIKIKTPKTEGHRPWTEPEVAQYEARHPIGTKARLALALGLYTALRKGDCLSLGPQNIRGGIIHVTQEKTGGKLQLPIRPELQEVLDATPSRHLKFLVKDSGEAYSGASFWHQFRKWCQEAGLPRACKFHGLRGTCATRLAYAGATPHEIMAWTGHKSLSQVQHYTRAADQLRLAREGLRKQNTVRKLRDKPRGKL